MKNIETILSDAGLELTEEQTKAITSAVGENYKPIADYQRQTDKVKSHADTIAQLQTQLAAFDGVDAEALKGKIAELTKTIEDNEAAFAAKIADRDFTDKLKSSIGKAKGKNEKAIMALLDIDTLKASKNQDKDIEDAIKILTEAEDSKMLFGEATPNVVGVVTVPGRVVDNKDEADLANLRKLMGLPPTKEK